MSSGEKFPSKRIAFSPHVLDVLELVVDVLRRVAQEHVLRPAAAAHHERHAVDLAETAPPSDAAAHAISARVDVLETTGSDVYAHLLLEGAEGNGLKLARGATAPEEPAAIDRTEIVARLDAASPVREGEPARLWVDASKLHLFDAETGLRLGGADG
jgi:multiple sugar transport system ATP-binding protein